ncbi:MAG TPA: type II secretion system protein [Verrucomicrobiae bacterium]|jgi:prepilin-type N-terminal cleavage/methylation domain-containing protein|nr:type II secretion system protein [Verrucomicrobiae bacterium]
MKTRIPNKIEIIRNSEVSLSRIGGYKHQTSNTNTQGSSKRPTSGLEILELEHSLVLGSWNLDIRPSNSLTPQRCAKTRTAFTLIELLVVIAIAAILSAMLLTAGGVMMRKSNIQHAISERDQLETAIDAYKAKYGFYPPSSTTGRDLTNQLYYELIGTTMTNYTPGGPNYFATLDGSSEVKTDAVVTAFGVSAFMNCKRDSDAENSIPAQTFLSGLKSGEIASNGAVFMIVTAANSDDVYKPMPGVYSLAGKPANAWRYICPGTNNPNSYDLWVQVFVGNHTNLICNWAKQPQLDVQLQ